MNRSRRRRRLFDDTWPRSITLTRSGDPDLYKAFAERFLDIVRAHGRLGVVLPRSAFATDGTAPFRAALFSSAGRLDLDAILNNRQWMFPDVHPQYTIMLVSALIDGNVEESTISVGGPADSRNAFNAIDAERVDWTLADLRQAIPDLAVPLLPSHRMATIFQRLVTSHPRFDSGKGGWRVLPWAEFHGTKDRKSGLLKEPGSIEGEWWPVYGGRSFDLWQPELWKRDGELQFILEPDAGLEELQAKRRRSSVWKAFPASVLRDPATLPMHKPRILFRDVTRATDSRSVRAALVPPHVFAHNSAPSLVWPSGGPADEAYLLGVMTSVPFDWIARRRVETHLNYFILNSLPVPRPSRDDLRREHVGALSARLAAIDERYADFAAANRVDHGPVSAVDAAATVAELDAVVAHLFGLKRDELEEMFEDFPPTEAGVSPGRRQAILEWYDRWAT